MQLTKNIFVETKIGGCNVGYLLTDDGIILIDTPQRPTVACEWAREISSKGTPKYLINTECHRDHFTGNCFFRVPVIGHEKTREGILSVSKETILSRVAVIDPEGYGLVAEREPNPPTITFTDRLTLHSGNHTVQLINHPGHTMGQTSVLIPEERVLFTGDNVFYRTQSFLYSGDVYRWLESLSEIEKLDVDYIVPGHGEVCGKSYLREQRAFIREWIDRVKEAVGLGWSKEEAVRKISFADRYPMSPGTEDLMQNVQKNNVSYLYDLLKAEQERASPDEAPAAP